ncbi:unnamed protein product [Chondrus crispus]|uniref:Uncharacterized protein n=1 Tax=Chondrus crispus TaxID=2769 RepID=R7QRC7_CHOCR|nr:unnamed protein product [Chondrus crispus]CDF40021.1 unnamed protein product [Chondrus crispus]|eukprot:XP_005710315.1 unnamed protein product [Chondrus crispus]
MEQSLDGLQIHAAWKVQQRLLAHAHCDARSMARFTGVACLSTLCRDGGDP